MRSFIIDLYEQLYKLHQTQFSRKQNSIIRVYRGQSLSISYLKLIRNNINGFISLNSFLSTSTDIDFAIGFAAAGEIADNLTHCLLQISIDPHMTNAAFAVIKDLSCHSDENELLINLGSICRIDDVEYDQDQELWKITLTLCDLDSYELKDLLVDMRKSAGNGASCLGWLMYKKGDFPRSIKYYQAAINDLTTSDLDRALCNRGLALISGEMKQFDKQIMYQTNARELFKQLSPIEYMIDIAQAQTIIGEAYVFKKEFEKAFHYLLASLFLLPTDHFGRANVFMTMANLYDERFEFKTALDFYNLALNIYHQHLNENDISFARLYSNIGVTYGRIGDSTKQLKYYHKARDIFNRASHPDHQQIAIIDDNIKRAKSQQTLMQAIDIYLYINSIL
ncbi:hypothetical protein I4U23_021963 [Adineta vaga]|nr:hypothetical protein I4U23_021963 [Adineta vaga]